MQPAFGWRLPSVYRFQVLLTLGVFAMVGILLATRTFPAPAWLLGAGPDHRGGGGPAIAGRRDGPCGDHRAGHDLGDVRHPGLCGVRRRAAGGAAHGVGARGPSGPAVLPQTLAYGRRLLPRRLKMRSKCPGQ